MQCTPVCGTKSFDEDGLVLTWGPCHDSSKNLRLFKYGGDFLLLGCEGGDVEHLRAPVLKVIEEQDGD